MVKKVIGIFSILTAGALAYLVPVQFKKINKGPALAEESGSSPGVRDPHHYDNEMTVCWNVITQVCGSS